MSFHFYLNWHQTAFASLNTPLKRDPPAAVPDIRLCQLKLAWSAETITIFWVIMGSGYECKYDDESQRDQRTGHVISENKPIDSHAPPHLNQTKYPWLCMIMTFQCVSGMWLAVCVCARACAFSWSLTQHAPLPPSAPKNPSSPRAKRLRPLYCYHGDR